MRRGFTLRNAQSETEIYKSDIESIKSATRSSRCSDALTLLIPAE